MNVAFRDAKLQKVFEQEGYIVLPSLLSDEDILCLTNLFASFQIQYLDAFHTTHFSTDVNHKKIVHDAIAKIVSATTVPYLNNFIPLFGNFMVKNSDTKNCMPMHADWTYVDEKNFCSVSVWVPLIDVDEKNGCFGVVAGSHKITNIIRGPQIKQTSSLERDKVWEKRYGKLIPMKAGDAIIYNHALLHYSLANTSNIARPAINLSMAPAVPWLHYCRPETDIEVYRVADTSFYTHYNN